MQNCVRKLSASSPPRRNPTMRALLAPRCILLSSSSSSTSCLLPFLLCVSPCALPPPLCLLLRFLSSHVPPPSLFPLPAPSRPFRLPNPLPPSPLSCPPILLQPRPLTSVPLRRSIRPPPDPCHHSSSSAVVASSSSRHPLPCFPSCLPRRAFPPPATPAAAGPGRRPCGARLVERGHDEAVEHLSWPSRRR